MSRSVVRTACTRDCPDACQILATVEDGRVVGLRGDPAHPVTRGFLCYRTDHYLERHYASDRLTSPLVRRGGSLEPATWDEALDLVAARLAAARDVHGPSSILHYQSGGSLGILKLLNRHFFELLGPITHKRGDICSGAGDAAQLADMGHEDAHDLDDLANSRAIVLWGKNAAETGVHLVPHLKAARARGVPIVQIDPVHQKKTLALCDRHWAPRPGTDGFLALGVARALFDEGLVDPDARSYCDDFDAFEALARRHDVASWCRIADVPEAAARDVADLLGRHRPAALFVGWGLARRLHGSATVRLLDALGALSGNLGVPGGGVSYYFQRRGGFDTSFVKRPENAGARTLSEPLLGEEILRADPPVKVAVIDNGNPVAQLPDSGTVARALASLDFVVVLDAFLTDTAELAHVVLPTTTMLEEHDVVGAYGHHYVQLAQPAARPPAGVRCDLEIYQALASRLGFGDRMAGSAEDWIDRLLAPMAEGGVTRARLREGGRRKPAAPRVLFEGRRFPTPTGRFRLLTEFPEAPPPLDEGFPLHLMSISTYKHQSSQIPRDAQREPAVVTLHPDAAPGWRDGELVMLASPIASAVVRLRFDPAQRRDLVIYPKGRWAKFGGPNLLTRARTTDAGEGAAYYDQGVRLEERR
ncbi:MAG TPA: molybdopterin-dependent oxidoreductase [Minicystis sp.]|nr:molybdopterin-dependent oxidoreductase [Minicystis sp.]